LQFPPGHSTVQVVPVAHEVVQFPPRQVTWHDAVPMQVVVQLPCVQLTAHFDASAQLDVHPAPARGQSRLQV
jgi:hypothetical protein